MKVEKVVVCVKDRDRLKAVARAELEGGIKVVTVADVGKLEFDPATFAIRLPDVGIEVHIPVSPVYHAVEHEII